MLTLDVACGNKPRGSVNLDLNIKKTNHRNYRGNSEEIDLDKTPNFVVGDCQYLPFNKNVFDLVTSYNTIEHMDDPCLFLKEIIRVTKNFILIGCPHRLTGKSKKEGVHKNFFNFRWFEDAFRKYGVYLISSRVNKWRGIPHNYLPLIKFPNEIEILGRKKMPKKSYDFDLEVDTSTINGFYPNLFTYNR